MTLLHRLLLLILAVASGITALVLLVNVGLPERARYTGQVGTGDLWIAPELNAIAPSFVRPTLAGDEINPETLRGSVVIINFWATWCEPCRVEMSVLQSFYEQNTVRILAVNLGESPDIIREWVDELGLTFDIVLDSTQSVAALYHLRGQPSTYIVSPGGVITHVFYGPVSETQLQAAVNG